MKWALVTAAVVALTMALFGTPVAADDAVLVQKLLAGSPWQGTWSGRSGNGTVELVFSEKGGNLQAAVQNITGSTNPRAGPVRFLKVKDGKVEFVTPVGNQFQLTLDSEGNLVGRGFQYGGDISVVYTPARR